MATDLILYLAPAAFGLTAYLAKDAYDQIKTKLKDVAYDQRQISRDLEAIKKDLSLESFNIKSIGDSMKSSASAMKVIESKIERLVVIDERVDQLTDRLRVSNDENGRILIVMKKFVEILESRKKQNP